MPKKGSSRSSNRSSGGYKPVRARDCTSSQLKKSFQKNTYQGNYDNAIVMAPKKDVTNVATVMAPRPGPDESGKWVPAYK